MAGQTTRLIVSHLAVVALGLAVAAWTSDAKADQLKGFVLLDNTPNGGPLERTATNNNIKIRVHFCNGDWITVADQPVSFVSEHYFAWIDGPGRYAGAVNRIEVSISGNDWFWLDRIALLFGDNAFVSELWHAGVNNTQGWCFSTDPTDGSDRVCEPDGSFIKRTWEVPETTCY